MSNLGGLLNPKTHTKTFVPKPVATMPDAQDPAVTEANRVAQLSAVKRAGRKSTILTSPQRKSYDSYSKKVTG